MNYKGIKVLVLDGYGRQIPSILHQLHQLGCIVTTINDSRLDVGFTSRYPNKRVVVRGIRGDMLLYKKAIWSELQRGAYDVIFPVLEPSTDICTSGEFSREFSRIKVLAAPRDAFLKAYDKQHTMKICMDNGIPCPITKMDGEPLEQYIEKVGFPIAAKPRRGSGGAGFKVIHSQRELDDYISKGIIKVEDYVLQEFIPRGGLQYGGYIVLDEKQEMQSILIVESCRWFPIDGGPGCYIRTLNHSGMTKSTIELFKALKWRGFGHVGFIMDPRDNTPKVMEINGRIPASIRICEWVGTKPVKNIMDIAFGVKLSKFNDDIPEKMALRYFHADLMWLIKSPNRFKSKPSWFDFKNSKDYIFSWSDPIPFFSYAIEHALTYKEDMKKRKH